MSPSAQVLMSRTPRFWRRCSSIGLVTSVSATWSSSRVPGRCPVNDWLFGPSMLAWLSPKGLIMLTRIRRPGSVPIGLAAFEVGVAGNIAGATTQHLGHAGAHVAGLEQGSSVVQDTLVGVSDAVVEVAADQRLVGSKCKRGAPRVVAGQLMRSLGKLLIRHDVVNDVPVCELLRGVLRAIEDDLLGARRAGPLGQSLRAAQHGSGPDVPLDLGEPGGFSGDCDVGAQYDLQPRRQAQALYLYHGGQRKLFESGEARECAAE